MSKSRLRSVVLLPALALGPFVVGCGEEEVPPPSEQTFEEGKQERMEIIAKEYGPAAAAGKSKPGR